MKIMHYRIKKNKKNHYICNQAVESTPLKLTDDMDRVTCKNCLKIIR